MKSNDFNKKRSVIDTDKDDKKSFRNLSTSNEIDERNLIGKTNKLA